MKKFLTLIIILSLFSKTFGQTTLDTAVDFNVKDVTGITHHLFNILDSNKYALVDFFSTSCGPCVTYAPDLEQAYVHYGENQGQVYFIGIVWGSSNAVVAAFDSTYGLTLPSVSGAQGNGNAVVTNFNVQSYPTTILIAPNRTIVNKYIYPPSFFNIDSVISSYLGPTTGIQPLNNNKDFNFKSLSPNPVNSELKLSFFIKGDDKIFIEVVDRLGIRVLYKDPVIYNPGNHLIAFNTMDLKPGMYFVNIYNESGRLTTQKFIRI